MRREKKSAAVSRLSPRAGLALPSIHRRPFAPRKRGSRFQPWGLKILKGRHRPARLCRDSPEVVSYLCSGRPGAAGGRTGAGDQHQGAEALGRSWAVCRAGRAPRCLLELLIPGARSFSGLSAAGEHPHAAISGEPGPAPSRAASPRAGRAPGARSRSCPYLRAGGARRGGRAGSHWPLRGEWWPRRWP